MHSFSQDLAAPILFHPLKHHLHFIRGFVVSVHTAPVSELKAALQTVGSSQLDLYTGKLSLQELSEEVRLYLQQHGLLSPEAYRRYLHQHNSDYRVITLSDTTTWVLRWGNVADRFVHLHPARYAANTTRVKANTLKTAIAAAIVEHRTNITSSDLSFINQVRKEWLALPPIKTIAKDDPILKLKSLLTS